MQLILTAAKVPFQIWVDMFTKYSPFSVMSSSLHVMVLHFTFLQFFRGNSKKRQQHPLKINFKKRSCNIQNFCPCLCHSVHTNQVLAGCAKEHVVSENIHRISSCSVNKECHPITAFLPSTAMGSKGQLCSESPAYCSPGFYSPVLWKL